MIVEKTFHEKTQISQWLRSFRFRYTFLYNLRDLRKYNIANHADLILTELNLRSNRPLSFPKCNRILSLGSQADSTVMLHHAG